MRLLVDTDVYCKLSISDLFRDAIQLLGLDLSTCSRLAALPHMLARGKLRKTYGPEACDGLIQEVLSMPTIVCPTGLLFDQLAAIPSIDPGEAQLFAVSSESDSLVMTGDKRALIALKQTPEALNALSGRIVVLEAILIALCDLLGAEVVREKIQRVSAFDTAVRVCFSPGNEHPRQGLESYFDDLAGDVLPLVLWDHSKDLPV